jgi:PIN domain nuclease of toxin-antitoxin system
VKFLLDTHIWLWSTLEPQRITRRVEKALVDPANELWLSPVSVGELIVLLRKGRVTIPDEVGVWVGDTVKNMDLTEAPLTLEVAVAIASISFPHGDPADHFIAASAKVFGLTLVTADDRLMRLTEIQVLANR